MSLKRVKKGGILLSAALLTTGIVGTKLPTYAITDPVAVSGTALPEGMKKVTSVEGITEYQMANGLRVLLFPDQSKPTVTVNIMYMVGSRHENYGETGMAHLLEHLLFKGSPRHTNIPQELTEHGARPNGTTWVDRTNYFEVFQATDANLEWALDLEADRMVNSFVAKKDLDSEMTVVRNEFEIGENEPSGVLFERTLSTAFLWHNYGNSTIGARADIENVPIDRLQAFYRNYYQPDNAVLIVAGKVDEEKTLKLINKYFAAIPKPTRQLNKTYTLDPTQDGERLVTLRRVGDVQAVCSVYHIPAASHPDYAATTVMASILGDFTTGRLKKALVDTKKATQAYGFTFAWNEPSIASFQAEVRQESNVEDAKETLLKTVEDFVNNPPTKEELERARTSILKNIELTLNSVERVGLQLSEWQAAGDWRLLFLHRDRIKDVTADDVVRVAKTYLKTSNRTVGLFVPTPKPDRAEIPAAPNVVDIVKNYKGNEAVATGEAFDPSPENIDNRTTRTTVGGLKIALLPKKNRGNTVNVTMAFRFGDEKSLFNRSTAGEFAGQMLMRGTKNKTREQIREEIDKLKAQVNVFGGATQTSASAETKRDNLKAVLTLIAEVLREPAFPQKEFDQLKEEQLAGIEQQRSEPTSIGFTAYGRHFGSKYPKGDVRYVSTPDEDIADIKAANLDDVKKFYADFYGASTGEITIVGDFDAAEAAKLIDELFGNWKSKSTYKRVSNSYSEVAAINKSFETPDKANAFFVAGMNLNLRDDDPDYPALIMGNYMLGGGFLNDRLATRIRQKEGLSYGVGSQLNADALEKSGAFLAFAFCAPENAEKVEVAFKDEMEKMLKNGFTAEELAGAKTGFLQSRQVSRAQDNELARRINNYQFLGRTVKYDAEFEQKIQSLTVDQVNAAMRKFLDVSKITIIKAGDFAKAAKK